MFHHLATTVPLLALAVLGWSQSTNTNEFINPPGGGQTGVYTGPDINSYDIGSVISLRWQVDYSTLSLSIIQTNLSQPDIPGVEQYLFQNQGGRSTFSWSVAAGSFDLAWSNVFWFRVYNSDDPTTWTASNYFNVSNASSPPAVPSSSSTPDSTSGLSAGAKVGIGVGVGLGTALLAGIGVLVFLVSRRKRALKAEHADPPTQEPVRSHDVGVRGREEKPIPSSWQAYQQGGSELSAPDVQELSTDTVVRELPATTK